MTLSEKIIKLRRATGLSQEELADRIGISRQAVSKWESSQSTPDIDKIILLSDFFGVSTDYLLKESISTYSYEKDENILQEDVFKDSDYKEEPLQSRASRKDVLEYISLKHRESKIIAIAVLFFIISPILLICLPVLSEEGKISETLAVLLGLLAIFSFVWLGTGLCIYSDMLTRDNVLKKDKYCTIDEESILYAKKLKADRHNFSTISLIIGVSLCILSPTPLIAAAFTGFINIIYTIGILLALVGAGCAVIVNSETYNEALERIISQNDSHLAKKDKQKNRTMEIINECYWTFVIALYLAVSFLTSRWDLTWIIWVASPIIPNIISLILKKK